jgi:hypothetical protein
MKSIYIIFFELEAHQRLTQQITSDDNHHANQNCAIISSIMSLVLGPAQRLGKLIRRHKFRSQNVELDLCVGHTTGPISHASNHPPDPIINSN